MLTPHLQKTIDDYWDNCWPVSYLRPLAILDLTSYIFFIKKTDDLELINKGLKATLDNNFIFSRMEEFSWDKLKNMDERQIHDLFTKDFGVIGIMEQYGHSGFLYSDFFKAPLLAVPAPKLLFNVIEIINTIEASDKNTQAAIAEYLFSKAEIKGQNGQEFIPECVSRLMISIAEPSPEEVIWDPAAGNGRLLINAATYIVNSNSTPAGHAENGTTAPRWIGMESDLVQLRLGAMNMILHGIENTNMEILPAKNVRPIEKPTLIISNLLFTGENNLAIEGNTSQPGHLEKEMVLLNLILENLEPGSRAVILVPETLLKSNIPAILKIRQDIVHNYHLEGVINLFPKSNSLFSGAGILIFNKHELITTDKVWFYKMEKIKKKLTVNESFNKSDQNNLPISQELNHSNEILNKWKKRKVAPINNPCNNFYLSAYDIKANDYNLNFNDYKLIEAGRELNSETENSIADTTNTIVTTKKENLHYFFEGSIPLQQKKRKRKVLPAVILLLILIAAGTGFYFFNFKDIHFAFFNRSKVADSVSNIGISDSSIQTGAETTKIDPGSNISSNNSSKKGETKPADIIEPASVRNLLQSKVKTENLNNRPTSIPKFTVINKAWFYRTPDTNTQKNFYLQAGKGLVLNPTAEENGFVYVVYVNKKRQTTKGWLNKKDLEPLE